ncbi:hypothetical protein O181_039155 [Austropuccinia psidii MF-1]|uniref:Uncharacterized protein n=1 Tax=Austropuccinia psidii MF-1 TaxID=1389203 RepID=A0A9Q3DB24_9BASI|nr:hypothetical protein [Austropuccinia psidii MF-1]
MQAEHSLLTVSGTSRRFWAGLEDRFTALDRPPPHLKPQIGHQRDAVIEPSSSTTNHPSIHPSVFRKINRGCQLGIVDSWKKQNTKTSSISIYFLHPK